MYLKQKLSSSMAESNLVRRLAQPSGDPELLNAKQKKIKELHDTAKSSKANAWGSVQLGGSSLSFVATREMSGISIPDEGDSPVKKRPSSALARPGSGGQSL